MRTIRHTFLTQLAPAIVVLLTGIVCAAPAQAAPSGPALKITHRSHPTNLVAGSSAPAAGASAAAPQFLIQATNVGGASTSGPVTFVDTLPAGVTPSVASPPDIRNGFLNGTDPCVVVGQVVTCSVSTPLPPSARFIVRIPVDVDPAAPASVTNQVLVSGGGAPSATSSLTVAVSSTDPPFGFFAGSDGLDITATAADGTVATQAGSHPYNLAIESNFPSRQIPGAPSGHDIRGAGALKDYSLSLPKGFVVDPTATPVRCTEAQLGTADLGEGLGCPPESQIGVLNVSSALSGFGTLVFPLYNMVPPPGKPASFGFDVLGTILHASGGLSGDFRLTADAPDTTAKVPIYGIETILWGDPSDPGHAPQRSGIGCSSGCLVNPGTKAFVTLPSACSGPLAIDARANSWQDPATFVTASGQTTDPDGNPAGIDGCGELSFNPSVTVDPASSAADSPTALDVRIQVPQSNGVNGRATATLKRAVVTLPDGMAVNPSAADGLEGCSPAEIDLRSPTSPHCPDGSKIGSVEITTPLLDTPLEGSVYAAKQNDNPFNSLLATYIVAEGQGIVLKLPGKVAPDPGSGQLTATFDDNPELPFTDLKVHFDGGSRAALVTPPACGTYQTTTSLSPWSAADPDNPTPAETATSSDSYQVTTGPDGGPCPDLVDPARFTPGFSAGTVTPLAGAYSPFVLKISKPDGQQSLKKIAVTLPLGLTAKLAGIPRCAQSAIVPGVGGSTNCPAASQVGTVTVSAGAGSTPFFLADQPVYLTDGYDGAPFGLAIDTHALAGPFDLGHVVVRNKLNIDPITTQVTADAEPLPSIIQGIPLHIRSVTLKMDRNAFVLNPTSCAAQTVTGQITGGGANFADPADDTVKSVTSPFQVGGCSDLGLSPKLAISLTGKGQTTDDKHPGVHATVSQPAGQSNLKKVTVTLPLALALDPDNAQALCEFTDGSKVDPTCPKGSIVGKATAHTPILDQALTGPVYFVKNIRKDPKSGREIRTLPKLVIPLTGENGLRLNLVGTSNVVNNHLVSTFDNIPDAPVSDFTLDIDGGKSGILVISGTDICKSTQVADQQINGQNGKTADADIYLQTSACPLKVISKKVGKTSVAVKVGGLGAGKVTVSGKGIKKTSKTITKSTVATITAKRTHGKPGKVTVSFDPTGPAKAHKTTK